MYLSMSQRNSRTAAAMDLFFNDSQRDCSYTSIDESLKKLFGNRVRALYYDEENYEFRGSENFSTETNDEETISNTASLGDISQVNDMNLKKNFPLWSITDDEFFPSDIGKQMILKDQDEHEKEHMYQNVASCSHWTVRSQRTLSESALDDHSEIRNHRNKRKRVSVGDFIKERSEPVGTGADCVFNQKVYFGYEASTPMAERRISFDSTLSETNETVLSSLEDPRKHLTKKATAALSPVLLYSTPKREENYMPRGFSLSLRSSLQKKLYRLKTYEERSVSRFEDETTIKLGQTMNLLSLENSQQNESLMELWTVQPQELTLDVKGKGTRLTLISNCDKELKFKTTFDGKLTNICPLSGVLPSKGQTGLRILVSSYIKRNITEDTEAIVTITCGNTKKDIHVKICQGHIRKKNSKRSFICF